MNVTTSIDMDDGASVAARHRWRPGGDACAALPITVAVMQGLGGGLPRGGAHRVSESRPQRRQPAPANASPPEVAPHFTEIVLAWWRMTDLCSLARARERIGGRPVRFDDDGCEARLRSLPAFMHLAVQR